MARVDNVDLCVEFPKKNLGTFMSDQVLFISSDFLLYDIPENTVIIRVAKSAGTMRCKVHANMVVIVCFIILITAY